MLFRSREQIKATEQAQSEANREIARTARDVGRAFVSAFEEAVIRGNSLRDVLAGLLEDLARIALRLAIEKPFEQVIGGLFPAAGGGTAGAGWLQSVADLFAGLFHSGGIVGHAASGRMVPALAFAGAPRFHMGGIAGDEVPIIARRGEEVLTTDDPRHRRKGGWGGIAIDVKGDRKSTRLNSSH